MNQTKEKKVPSRAVDLLWTGGWDSTYRLLHLILINKLPVNTHYVIHHTRRSRFIEMETMIKIQEKIINSYPGTDSLFKKMVLISRSSIPENEEVIKRCENLEKNKKLGGQYRYLARYAKIHSTRNLEIGIQSNDFEEKFEDLLGEHMRLNSNESGFQFWELVDVDPNEDISIFAPFRFPIWRTPKLQMKAIAEEYGFLDILEMSWFCHKPVKGKACGVCHPCVAALKEGMQYRFPRSAILRNKIMFDPLPREIRYFLQYIFRTLKKIFTQPSGQSNDK